MFSSLMLDLTTRLTDRTMSEGPGQNQSASFSFTATTSAETVEIVEKCVE